MYRVRNRALDARNPDDARSRVFKLVARRQQRSTTMIASPESPARRLYVRTASAADRGSWSVERDINWKSIDRRRAYERPEILISLRDAALIESYHPVNLARLLKATWDDVDASVVFSLELFEGFKHFHVLRMYLEAIDYQPAIT